MTRILVDATTLIALGTVGRLHLLGCFDGRLDVPAAVTAEVTSQPAQANLRQFIDEQGLSPTGSVAPDRMAQARDILDEDDDNGDVLLVASILASDGDGAVAVAVVSDDRRVRTVARGFGATVTGTIGVVVRAVSEGLLTPDEAKELVRDLDRHGLHTTGALREKADALIDDAADDSE